MSSDSHLPENHDIPVAPPPINTPPSLPADPHLTPPTISRPSAPGRQVLAVLLSLCLGLFLADAAISLVTDSLGFFLNVGPLGGLRGSLALLSLLFCMLIYGLMGLTPLIPKRLFLPITLFNPVSGLLGLAILVHLQGGWQQLAWGISFCQALCALAVLRWSQGGFKLRWLLITESQLGTRSFSWANLIGFTVVNLLILLPATAAYLVFGTSWAVSHLSDDFLKLNSKGLTVQVRHYVRPDGKTIQLVPMAHIGDPGFYRRIAQSFPTNSLILMEGVSDDRNLLTNRISYKRAAKSLGLAEQQQEFRPTQGKMVQADIDVGQFSPSTIDFLNVTMLVHAKGLNPASLLELTQYSPPPSAQKQLFTDLLTRRNQHLLGEINIRLKQAEHLVVPWGAAHMPEIGKALQASGFRVDKTEDHLVIRFRGRETKASNAR